MSSFQSGILVFFFIGLVCALGQQPIISFNGGGNTTLLGGAKKPVAICVDSKDWKGVLRAAHDLAYDFGRVTGTNGTVTALSSNSTESPLKNCNILVGTINKSRPIDNLVNKKTLNVRDVRGKWEAFRSQAVQKTLVIAGSDKRGTIYGIYDVSEQIGVSPWYFWADVAPIHQQSIYALAKPKTQKPPSIKYRGFFINDEAPALSSYIKNNFPDLEYGPGYNHVFYSTVFELILRLRSNLLWPAMWGSMFNRDDPDNQRLADEFGIVMGTSHTEPLACATKEWGRFGNGSWDWRYNEQNVRPFFESCAKRASPYDTMYTIGMRGYDDTAMSTGTEIELLEEIVNAQRDILFNANNGELVPQCWTLYEEVMDYYTLGMKVPDDVITIWADDNWGGIRRLPMKNETGRVGGSGVYYHFDLVGAPRSHRWMNTVQLERTLEQMYQAYVRGARSLWIVNVGDIKPMEIPTNHFLDLAYDIELWDTFNSTSDWLTQWATREFGKKYSVEAAKIAQQYGRLAARRPYEAVNGSVLSLINYEEADKVLSEWKSLGEQGEALHGKLPDSMRPSFFEMILHPILAGTIVYDIHITGGLNQLYVVQGRNSANTMAQRVIALMNDDHDLTKRYNELLGGKWNGMMEQTHLGYTYWQQPMRQFSPAVSFIHPGQVSLFGHMGVSVEGSRGRLPGDSEYQDLNAVSLDLPRVDPYGNGTYFEVFATGTSPVNWNVTTEPYIKLSKAKGTVCPSCNDTGDTRVYVDINWGSVPQDNGFAMLNFSMDGPLGAMPPSSPPSLRLPFNRTEIPKDFSAGFVESQGHIAIEAEHYTRLINGSNITYTKLPGYGRTQGAVSLTQYLEETLSTDIAPRLEYDFYKFSNAPAPANLTMILGTGLNNHPGQPLTYAVQVDQGAIQKVSYISEAPLGRLSRPDGWDKMVFDGAWVNKTQLHDPIDPGKHTLKVWLLQPGTVLTKLILDFGGVRESYLGPPESFRLH